MGNLGQSWKLLELLNKYVLLKVPNLHCLLKYASDNRTSSPVAWYLLSTLETYQYWEGGGGGRDTHDLAGPNFHSFGPSLEGSAQVRSVIIRCRMLCQKCYSYIFPIIFSLSSRTSGTAFLMPKVVLHP